MSRFSRAQRGAFAGAALVVLMALGLVFAPLSTLADDLVGQFRQVQIAQFQAITIPLDLSQLGSGTGSGLPLPAGIDPSVAAAFAGQLQGLGTPSTTFDQNSFTKVNSIAEARAQFSGNLLVPSTTGSFTGQPANIGLSKQAGSISYALNVAKASQLLQQVGLGTDWLPANQETVTFRLDLQPLAALEWEQDGKHLVVGQTINPTMNIPANVDMDKFRSEVLANPLVAAALGPNIKAQLQNVKDWQHTLIIPVPQGAGTQQVTVNSTVANNGLLITSDKGAGVIWLQNGVLHVVASDAPGTDVLAIAKSEQ